MNELIADQLPLRKRGALEIFDVSLKLYKRYFVPIIVWSILSGIAGFVGILIPGMGYVFSFVVTPLLLGAVGCCLAAAVHGRDVDVKDTWSFVSKRYGAILLVYVLCVLMLMLIAFAMGFILILLGIGGGIVASSTSRYSLLLTVVGVAGIVVSGVLAGFIFTCAISWMTMTPLALCLEGNGKDNTRFLRRTYDLMAGHWWRVFVLVSIVGLAMMALSIIFAGLASLVVGLQGLKDIFSGQISPSNMTRIIAGYMGSFSLISILCTPFFYLALGVQYLDLRVRKEALDLEWAAQEEIASFS